MSNIKVIRKLLKKQVKAFKTLDKWSSKDEVKEVLNNAVSATAVINTLIAKEQQQPDVDKRIRELTETYFQQARGPVVMVKAVLLAAAAGYASYNGMHAVNVLKRIPRRDIAVTVDMSPAVLGEGFYSLMDSDYPDNFMVILHLGERRLAFTTRDVDDLITYDGQNPADGTSDSDMVTLAQILLEFRLEPSLYYLLSRENKIK